MGAIARGNAGFARFAKASSEYVSEIVAAKNRLGGRQLTAAEKKNHLATLLNDQNGIKRIGQQMIGPIQLKLRYQGLLRNVLLEDTLEPGVPVEYDVLDDLGQAYQLHSNAGEVKITPFEGKRVTVQLFRIATWPQIKKEDLYYLRANIVEFAQDESKQAIMKQEDSYLISLLEAAITAYSSLDPYGNSHVVSAPAGVLTPDVLYDAVSITDQLELESKRLLFNNVRYRDLYRWDINTTGWAFKDRVVAGEKIVQFGEFQIGKSIIVPNQTVYLTPEPEFLGVFPVMYSLDVEENNKVETFHKGWVMDELVGFAVLNPRGLVKIALS